MPNTTQSTGPDTGPLSRRRLLLASLAASLGVRARADEQKGKPEAPSAKEIAPIQEQFKAAKLRGIHFSQTEHYLGAGDAPAAFRAEALRICQALAVAYQKHFQDKGFTVKFPRDRLLVITLKDVDSYAAFLGSTPDANIGGHYDIDKNWLAMFDFRGDGQDFAASPERLNMFTLVHEALHQLTFNTGLLERKGDVPKCISEGLAMYGELWQLKNRRGTTLGQVNSPRLQVIAQIPNLEDSWIPTEQLVTEDRLFDLRATQQLAYAEAWALAHYALRAPTRAKFRDYLKDINRRRDPGKRAKDLKAHFGDLAKLDAEVRHHISRMI